MLQNAGFRALAEHVAGKVHPSVAGDPAAAERHRDVILTHLAVGAAPFAALPALLAFGAAPAGAGLVAFAWLTAPIVIALSLSRSGALDRSVALAGVAFAALGALSAFMTGGLASPAIALCFLPLIDAALAGSARGAKACAAAAAAAVLALLVATLAGLTPAVRPDLALSIVTTGAGAVYALALAFRAAACVRAGAAAQHPSDARFEQFAGSIDDLVTRHAPDGAVTFASPAARDLLDASARELSGHGLFERVHLADRPAFLQALSSACERDDAARVDLRVRRSDAGRPASYLWVEMRARRVRPHEVDAASAKASPVVAAFRDVGARKTHDEELVAAREEAERASLAKTRFLAHMSHELRTPLNAIIGFSEVLSDDTLCRLTPERRSDYAALIHRSGAHLLEVVNSILDMARIESGAFSIAPRPCALGPLVDHCVSLMAMKAEAGGVTLTAAIAADVTVVEADPRAVTQVILNLLANAIKFTPRGGAVSVALDPRQNGIVLTVRDTGVGIAPEHIARLGEAFFQAESAGRHEGAGLGLSVVRGLVALHGGEFSVESVIGRGAAVSVFLPARATDRAPRSTPISPSLSSAYSEKVKLRA